MQLKSLVAYKKTTPIIFTVVLIFTLFTLSARYFIFFKIAHNLEKPPYPLITKTQTKKLKGTILSINYKHPLSIFWKIWPNPYKITFPDTKLKPLSQKDTVNIKNRTCTVQDYSPNKKYQLWSSFYKQPSQHKTKKITPKHFELPWSSYSFVSWSPDSNYFIYPKEAEFKRFLFPEATHYYWIVLYDIHTKTNSTLFPYPITLGINGENCLFWD